MQYFYYILEKKNLLLQTEMNNLAAGIIPVMLCLGCGKYMLLLLPTRTSLW